METNTGFGKRLSLWRRHRKLSQLELAHRAGVSQRHLSFLEINRTNPSREMVMRLARVLELPLRQQNMLLLAGGYAPAWRESALDAPELEIVNSALGFMLAQQEPYPAVVLDRRWNLLRANRGARALIAFLTDTPAWVPDPKAPINLADALVAPGGLRPLLVNWSEVVRYFLVGVQADATADGTEETATLLDRLLNYSGVSELVGYSLNESGQHPVLPMQFSKDGMNIQLFTTIATLGTPQDVTAQEIRVENFFPADTETSEIFVRWAARESLAT
jgi:transcriptional regulator with XRE-family HTH domain